MPATKEELKKYNRYEVITVSPHFGQTVVGIYQTIKEAQAKKEILFRSQALPLVIYDTVEQKRVRANV
tara:strand:- start:167 stop:370 length:204 start_codon:yes stop_codon:yes gene_type:complete